ncbi:hypothetical protein RJ639_047558 [Escallonia herrerae]|uniref:Uncharacterized protein n=1 Tax=Escallonia herrerae TaxID=1293975 RepID=A0AA88WHM7_9ASTE|nr:hypothetical protein RJ639_047558 [Escallonia herrerae]
MLLSCQSQSRFQDEYLSVLTTNKPEHVNEIDFDYMEYARQRFKQYWLRKHEILGSSGATAVFTVDGLERNNGHKFWSLSFSLVKDMKMPVEEKVPAPGPPFAVAMGAPKSKKPVGKGTNRVEKRGVPLSPRELHCTANRAQAEEMRKKTFLPYRQGLLRYLRLSSKSYGAMNGFARALNPVSSSFPSSPTYQFWQLRRCVEHSSRSSSRRPASSLS